MRHVEPFAPEACSLADRGYLNRCVPKPFQVRKPTLPLRRILTYRNAFLASLPQAEDVMKREQVASLPRGHGLSVRWHSVEGLEVAAIAIGSITANGYAAPSDRPSMKAD